MFFVNLIFSKFSCLNFSEVFQSINPFPKTSKTINYARRILHAFGSLSTPAGMTARKAKSGWAWRDPKTDSLYKLNPLGLVEKSLCTVASYLSRRFSCVSQSQVPGGNGEHGHPHQGRRRLSRSRRRGQKLPPPAARKAAHAR
jgi:hypothetical protein